MVHLAYLVSWAGGQVDGCFPYLEGCTSISRAARQAPAIHLFRAVMIPVAAAMAATWMLVAAWLRALGEPARHIPRALAGLGVTGAVFLVLYAVFLGTEGVVYGLLRRYGVTMFFAFTALAELILTSRLLGMTARGATRLPGWLTGTMYACCAGMLGLGLANIPVANVLDIDAAGNVIEWLFALLMFGYFGLLAAAWRRTGFALDARLEGFR